MEHHSDQQQKELSQGFDKQNKMNFSHQENFVQKSLNSQLMCQSPQIQQDYQNPILNSPRNPQNKTNNYMAQSYQNGNMFNLSQSQQQQQINENKIQEQQTCQLSQIDSQNNPQQKTDKINNNSQSDQGSKYYEGTEENPSLNNSQITNKVYEFDINDNPSSICQNICSHQNQSKLEQDHQISDNNKNLDFIKKQYFCQPNQNNQSNIHHDKSAQDQPSEFFSQYQNKQDLKNSNIKFLNQQQQKENNENEKRQFQKNEELQNEQYGQKQSVLHLINYKCSQQDQKTLTSLDISKEQDVRQAEQMESFQQIEYHQSCNLNNTEVLELQNTQVCFTGVKKASHQNRQKKVSSEHCEINEKQIENEKNQKQFSFDEQNKNQQFCQDNPQYLKEFKNSTIFQLEKKQHDNEEKYNQQQKLPQVPNEILLNTNYSISYLKCQTPNPPTPSEIKGEIQYLQNQSQKEEIKIINNNNQNQQQQSISMNNNNTLNYPNYSISPQNDQTLNHHKQAEQNKETMQLQNNYSIERNKFTNNDENQYFQSNNNNNNFLNPRFQYQDSISNNSQTKINNIQQQYLINSEFKQVNMQLNKSQSESIQANQDNISNGISAYRSISQESSQKNRENNVNGYIQQDKQNTNIPYRCQESQLQNQSKTDLKIIEKPNQNDNYQYQTQYSQSQLQQFPSQIEEKKMQNNHNQNINNNSQNNNQFKKQDWNSNNNQYNDQQQQLFQKSMLTYNNQQQQDTRQYTDYQQNSLKQSNNSQSSSQIVFQFYEKKYTQQDLNKAFGNQSNIQEIIEKTWDYFHNVSNKNVQQALNNLDQKVQSISMISSLKDYANNNVKTQDLLQSYLKVEKEFPIQILIRGDGNCFYRSAIMNYLIKLVVEQKQEAIIKLFIKVWQLNEMKYQIDQINIELSKDFIIHFLYFWIYQYMLLHQDKNHKVLDILLEYNKYPFLDAAGVVICRNLILNKFNDLLISNDCDYMAFIEEDQRKQIPIYLNKYGQEAEDVIIPICSQAFEIDLTIQSLYRQSNRTIQNSSVEYKFKEGIDSEKVSVLFTKGHYNCIFDQEFYQKNKRNFIIEQEVIQNQDLNMFSCSYCLSFNDGITVISSQNKVICSKCFKKQCQKNQDLSYLKQIFQNSKVEICEGDQCGQLFMKPYILTKFRNEQNSFMRSNKICNLCIHCQLKKNQQQAQYIVDFNIFQSYQCSGYQCFQCNSKKEEKHKVILYLLNDDKEAFILICSECFESYKGFLNQLNKLKTQSQQIVFEKCQSCQKNKQIFQCKEEKNKMCSDCIGRQFRTQQEDKSLNCLESYFEELYNKQLCISCCSQNYYKKKHQEVQIQYSDQNKQQTSYLCRRCIVPIISSNQGQECYDVQLQHQDFKEIRIPIRISQKIQDELLKNDELTNDEIDYYDFNNQ